VSQKLARLRKGSKGSCAFCSSPKPEASVTEKDGYLAIVKFPPKNDEINTVVWGTGLRVPGAAIWHPPFLNPVSQPSPAGYFELDSGKAREIVAHLGRAVSSWRDGAARQGLARGGIDRFASAWCMMIG
jgi:hypothetical protein